MKRLLPILLLLLAFLLAGCSQDPAEPAETAAPAAEPAAPAAEPVAAVTEPAPAGQPSAETDAPAPAAPEATLPQIIQPEPVIWLPFPRTDTSWRAIYKGEGGGEGSVRVDSKRDGFNVTGLVPGDSEITLEAPDTGETVVYQIHVDDDLNVTCEPVERTPAASGTGEQDTPRGGDTEMPLDTDAPGPAQTVTPGSLNP